MTAASLQCERAGVPLAGRFAYDFLMRKALLLGCLLASPALAETQDDVLRARFLPGWRQANGHYMAALDLDLAPLWKTYWRAPGDAGIPPVFDWTGSKNLKSVQFHWPRPQVLHQNGMMTIAYQDELVLPIEVIAQDPSKPVELALSMGLGICHDICMPAHLTFAGDLAGQGATDSRITAALKAVPDRGPGARCTVEPIADGLRLTARIPLPAGRAEETVVFETPDPQVWVAAAETRREGGVLISQTDLVPPGGAPFALDRSGVTLTVLSGSEAVEIKGCPAP